MEIRKGPYGYFAFERLSKESKVNEYAIELINEGVINNFLPVYHYEQQEYIEFSYDFSGLSQIKDLSVIDINIRRKAISDLFFNFHKSLNLLLPLSNLEINSDYLFYSHDKNKIYLCYRPIFKNYSMNLEQLNGVQIENLLNQEFFSQALTIDEQNQLIYAIKSNDETLFINACNSIKKEIKSKGKQQNNSLIEIIVLIIPTIALILLKKTIWALILVAIYIVYRAYKNNTKRHKKEENEAELMHKTRKEILFNNDNKSAYISNCLFLSSITSINGEEFKNAIYTTHATIGSDYFLSDVFIDDNSVHSLNAEINRNETGFTIICHADPSNMLLEGVKLSPQKEYELKDGQTLTIGNIELSIKIGFDF